LASAHASSTPIPTRCIPRQCQNATPCARRSNTNAPRRAIALTCPHANVPNAPVAPTPANAPSLDAPTHPSTPPRPAHPTRQCAHAPAPTPRRAIALTCPHANAPDAPVAPTPANAPSLDAPMHPLTPPRPAHPAHAPAPTPQHGVPGVFYNLEVGINMAENGPAVACASMHPPS
jgi:hypothetical protein